MEKTVEQEFGSLGDDQHASSEKTEQINQDMNFEIVSFSLNERELTRKKKEERTTLENSSDFCNGFLNITKDPGSFPDSKSLPLEEGQEKGNEGESMEIVENHKTCNGKIEHLPDEHATTPPDGNKQKPNDARQTETFCENEDGYMEHLSHENATALQNENKKESDVQQEEPVGQHKAETRALAVGELEAETIIKQSSSASTENTVQEPNITLQKNTGKCRNESDEQNMLEKLEALDVRKRKSPEREISFDCGKKMLLSDNIPRLEKDNDGKIIDGDNKDKEMEEDEADEVETEDSGEDAESKDEEVKGGSNPKGSSTTNKKSRPIRKKSKLKYQKKKGQLSADQIEKIKSKSSSTDVENSGENPGQSENKQLDTCKSKEEGKCESNFKVAAEKDLSQKDDKEKKFPRTDLKSLPTDNKNSKDLCDETEKQTGSDKDRNVSQAQGNPQCPSGDGENSKVQQMKEKFENPMGNAETMKKENDEENFAKETKVTSKALHLCYYSKVKCLSEVF